MTTGGLVLVTLDATPRSRLVLPVARALAGVVGAHLEIVTAGDLVRHADERRTRFVVTGASTAEQALDEGSVLREARCPVVVVPESTDRSEWTLRRVLLPLDGTAVMATGIRPASELAALGGAALYVVHVMVPDAERPTEAGARRVPAYVDRPEHEWPAWTDEFLEWTCELCALPERAGVQLYLAAGDPGGEVVRIAAEHAIDLIVVAWHGEPGVTHARTLRSILARSSSPIMILRAPPGH